MIFTYTNDAEVMLKLSTDCLKQDLNCSLPNAIKSKLRSLFLYQQIEGDEEEGCTGNLLLKGTGVLDAIQSDLLCYQMEDGVEAVNYAEVDGNINLTILSTDIKAFINILDSLDDFVAQSICSLDIRVKVKDDPMLLDKLITKNYLDVCKEYPIISSGSYILTLNHKLSDEAFYTCIASILCKCIAGVNKQIYLEFELDIGKVLNIVNILTDGAYSEKDIMPYISRK